MIDWTAVAASGKRFVGHSDFTAFNLALLAQTGGVSYSGASLIADFGGEERDDLTEALFGEVVRDELEILSFESDDADAVDCRGTLWGGNLATLCALAGTLHAGYPRRHSLLEDVAEHPYRVERMLTQLWHAGVLARQHAIVLERVFRLPHLAPHDNGFDMPSVVQWLRDTVGVPVVTGLPYGHVASKATLPVGVQAGRRPRTAWPIRAARARP